MKMYVTENREEAIKFAEFLRAKGASVTITPIAKEFRKVGGTRPVVTKYYIKVL